jgi:hypothetical protein
VNVELVMGWYRKIETAIDRVGAKQLGKECNR